MQDWQGVEGYVSAGTGALDLGEGEQNASESSLLSLARRFSGELGSSYENPGGFDSDFYLGQYPDVAAAVSSGAFESAWEHWLLFGKDEGRMPVGASGNVQPPVGRDSLTGMVEGDQFSGESDPLLAGGAVASSQTLEQGLQKAQQLLTAFATSPDFSAKMPVAFGDNWDVQKAGELAQAWARGDFSAIPRIEIRSTAEIRGGGAFAGATETIYISRELLSNNAGNVEEVAGVLLEEIGHAVDKQLNAVDAPGDEGDIFSALVRGETLDESELQRLKTKDDTLLVTLDTNVVQLERAGMPAVINTLADTPAYDNPNTVLVSEERDGIFAD